MSREVLLTGSVPREPAAEAFGVAMRHLRGLMRRIPDGEQKGWGGSRGIFLLHEHPLLEPGPQAPMTTSDSPFSAFPPMTMRKLKAGVEPGDFSCPPGDVAEIKLNSFQQFDKMQAAGEIPAGVRFQATVPGPATTGGLLYMPLSTGVQAVGDVTIGEIRKITDGIPHERLAIQLDLAVEVESEEIRRRPGAFGMPIFSHMFEGWGDWRFEDLVEQVARVAATVPEDVELGFHLCGCWHIDPRGGQDLNVHVDWANALTERVPRRIDYIHMASIPEHDRADYASLQRLRLPEETKLYLGLINSADGIDGARRRIAAAAEYRSDFGVAHFCGTFREFGVDTAKLDDLLELHRAAAEL